MIDTLAFAERLRAGGADERLAKAAAEAVAHALRESDEVRWREMATKADIVALQRDIAELRASTQSDIAELRASTQSDIAGLKVNIADLKAELLKWVIGLLLG